MCVHAEFTLQRWYRPKIITPVHAIRPNDNHQMSSQNCNIAASFTKLRRINGHWRGLG